MKEKGLVSCIIPTYKRNDMLPRAIESVLQQTYKNIEILVVDDNEPGDVFFNRNVELIKRYADNHNVCHIKQAHHTNGAVARNLGIKSAKGEFVAFLDDDDVWLPDKIEKQVGYLNSNKDCGAVTCLYEIYSNDNLIGTCPAYSGDNLLENVFLRSVAICTPTFCGRAETVLQSRCFDPNLKRHQDVQFYIDFLTVSTIEPINEVLLYIYADSNMNRPNTERLIRIKSDFFNSIGPVLEKYPKAFKKRVYNAHYFEIIFTAIKEKKFIVALKYLMKIGLNIKSYRDVYKRYKTRR